MTEKTLNAVLVRKGKTKLVPVSKDVVFELWHELWEGDELKGSGGSYKFHLYFRFYDDELHLTNPGLRGVLEDFGKHLQVLMQDGGGC